MSDEDLAWAVEGACLNAWPSPRQVLLGPWLARAAGGPSRRINSVNPLRAQRYDPAAVIEPAEALYAGLGQALAFRVPAIATGLDAALARAGLDGGHETCTLFTPLDGMAAIDPAVTLTAAPSASWLALRSLLNAGDAVAERVVRDVLGCLILPKTFVEVRAAQGLASIAMGALDRGLLVVEAVGTAPDLRGRGHARQAVAALMAWASTRGARGACLQVVAANGAGRRLYDRLGFRTDLYHYHYRSRVPVG